MVDYQPHLIADFRTGMQLGMEPWLLPSDGFSSLVNCHIKNGYLEKRYGIAQWGSVDIGTEEVCAIIPHSTNWNIIIGSTGVFKVNEGSGLSTLTASAYSGNFIYSFDYSNNGDTTYYCNNIGQMRSYDGTTEAVFNIDIDGGGNDVSKNKLVFWHKNRLIVFAPTESSVAQEQRARWCAVNDPSDWTNDEFSDCPTNQSIIGGIRYKGEIIIFFDKSVWAFIYTGDSTLPFRWEPVHETTGAKSLESIVADENMIYFRGNDSFYSTDLHNLQRIDEKLGDYFRDNTNISNDRIMEAVYDRRNRRIIWLIWVDGDNRYQRVLIYNLTDKSFSIYDLPTTISTIGIIIDLNLGVSSLVDDIVMMGDTSGRLLELTGEYGNENAVKHDLTANIAMEAKSGIFNPFTKLGKQCDLGYIDFLVEKEAGTTVSLDLYINHNTTKYATKTLDLGITNDKEWIRIDVNTISQFHQFRLYDDADDQHPKIHAIMLWMKPGGPLV